jgi:hypothetical protein
MPRIPTGANHALRLLPGGDVRHDDAAGAAVEHPADQRRVVLVDAHDGGHAPQIGGAGEIGDVLEVGRTVLGLDPHSIEPGGPEVVDQVRRVPRGVA